MAENGPMRPHSQHASTYIELHQNFVNCGSTQHDDISFFVDIQRAVAYRYIYVIA